MPVFEQLFHPLLLGGAGLGEVPAVPGMGAEPADRLRRHEAGGDRAPLGDLSQPDRAGPAGLRQARQRLDLPGVIQLTLQPLGFEQEEHRFPVVASGLHPGLGHAPAAQPVPQRLQFAPGGGEGPGLLLAAARGGIAGHPDGCLDLGLGDVQAGGPLGEQRLVVHVVHHQLLRKEGGYSHDRSQEPGASVNLVRGLEAPFSGPEDWLPASDFNTGSSPPR